MTYLIIILILVFGCALTGIGVRLIYGQRRIERRQAVTEAAIRATLGPPPPSSGADDSGEPDRRHGLALVPPIAVLAGVAMMLRQHWRTVSAVAGALAATAVVLGLILGHNPAAAGPPLAGQPTTASLTGATAAPTPAVSSSGARSAPGTSATSPRASAPAPSSIAAVPVVLTGEAPARPQPSAVPSSSVPVPSRSPSAPGTPNTHPPRSPTPTGSSSAACLVAVNARPILAVCLLGT